MPFSFAEQFKRIFGGKKGKKSPQLSTPAPKDFLAQQRAQGLQTKAPNQLPAVEEQVDISETITPIAQTQPLPPTGVGTTPTAGGQVGVPTQPLAPGGVSLATTTAAPPLGITSEQIAQYRESLGQQRTPEMIEEERKSQELLEQLIPFRQQLAQAQAPTEAIGELDVQIGELQRQIERTRPEALVGRAETLAGAGLEARARRAPVQTELTELLFQRSALGQRRAAEAQRAQAGITALESEFDIRQAMAQLGRPAELPAGIQTEIFKRAFPGAEAEELQTQVIDVGGGRKQLINKQTGEIIRSFGGGLGKLAPGSIDPKDLTPLAKTIYDGTMKLTDITPTMRARIAPELNAVGWTSAIKAEDKQTVLVIKDGLKDVLAKWKKVPERLKGQIQGRLADWTYASERTPSLQRFEAAKRIVGQQLTRLFEKGRISDEDRIFYQALMPNIRQSSYEVAKAGAESLEERLGAQLTSMLKEIETEEKVGGEEVVTEVDMRYVQSIGY